jgi:hypothetical protein
VQATVVAEIPHSGQQWILGFLPLQASHLQSDSTLSQLMVLSGLNRGIGKRELAYVHDCSHSGTLLAVVHLEPEIGAHSLEPSDKNKRVGNVIALLQTSALLNCWQNSCMIGMCHLAPCPMAKSPLSDRDPRSSPPTCRLWLHLFQDTRCRTSEKGRGAHGSS